MSLNHAAFNSFTFPNTEFVLIHHGFRSKVSRKIRNWYILRDTSLSPAIADQTAKTRQKFHKSRFILYN